MLLIGLSKILWDLICSIADQSALPWCIFGDSNDLLSSDEKIGNRDHPNWLIQDFCEVISDCNLHDLPIEDYTYTWARRKGKANAIKKKLNRALATCDWMDLFPNFKLINAMASKLDHSPILLLDANSRRFFRK
ncbi:hypothetical protein AAZX31_12G113500 [Glycine max]